MIVLRLVVNLVIFLVPAGIMSIGASRLSRASRDEWKLLAWVPPIPLAIWGVRIAWDVTRDPTSHNLWPFELIVWALVSLGLLGLFLVGRRLLA